MMTFYFCLGMLAVSFFMLLCGGCWACKSRKEQRPGLCLALTGHPWHGGSHCLHLAILRRLGPDRASQAGIPANMEVRTLMHKSGATYPNEIREYFNPLDSYHVIAFHQYKLTGRWPDGFVDEGEIWFLNNGWQQELETMIAAVPVPPKVRSFLEEFERVKGVIDAIEFPQYQFVLEPLGESFTVHVRYSEPDVFTNVVEEQNGRKWLFPAGQTEGQLVQTAFKALLTSLEHRARENFLWNGKPILQPHLDARQLLKMMEDRTHHTTAINFTPEGYEKAYGT